MPDRAVLDAFIAAVESNDHVGAIRDFYADDATMQENLTEPPRRGRQVLMDHEAAALARVNSVRSTCVPPVLVAGDTVVIHWVFEFDLPDGRKRRFEELAHQTWRGNKIQTERFYYDPATTAAK